MSDQSSKDIKLELLSSQKKILHSYGLISQEADRVSRNLLLANAGGIAAALGIIGALISNGNPPGGALFPLTLFFIGLLFAGLDSYKNYTDAKNHQNLNKLQSIKLSEKLNMDIFFDKEKTKNEYNNLITAGI